MPTDRDKESLYWSNNTVLRQSPVTNHGMFLVLRNADIGGIHQARDADTQTQGTRKAQGRKDGIGRRIRQPRLAKGIFLALGNKGRSRTASRLETTRRGAKTIMRERKKENTNVRNKSTEVTRRYWVMGDEQERRRNLRQRCFFPFPVLLSLINRQHETLCLPRNRSQTRGQHGQEGDTKIRVLQV